MGTVAPMNDVSRIEPGDAAGLPWQKTWSAIRPAGGHVDEEPAIRQRHSPPAM